MHSLGPAFYILPKIQSLTSRQCDKMALPEGCTQCVRAKRKCPGYRALGDLLFRDQSSNVIRKFKAKEERDKASSKSHTSVREATEETDSGPQQSLEIAQQHRLPLTFSLAPSIEDIATGFF